MKNLFLILVAAIMCGCASSGPLTKPCTSNVHCNATEYCQRRDVYTPVRNGASEHVWRDGRCQPDTQ